MAIAVIKPDIGPAVGRTVKAGAAGAVPDVGDIARSRRPSGDTRIAGQADLVNVGP